MTTATLLSAFVGNAFLSTEQSSAIIEAQNLLGTVDGDSDNSDRATMMVAYNIMVNQRILKRIKNGETNLTPMKLEEIITPEIRALLVSDEDYSEGDPVTIGYSNNNPTDDWSV